MNIEGRKVLPSVHWTLQNPSVRVDTEDRGAGVLWSGWQDCRAFLRRSLSQRLQQAGVTPLSARC